MSAAGEGAREAYPAYARNRASRESWDCFEPHRRRVSGQLVAAAAKLAPAGSLRLCVLGAGNCNDLDLAQLTRTFAEVHLVDLDAAALADGMARQSQASAERLMCHGNTEVTGILDTLLKWQPSSPPPDREIQMLLARAQSIPLDEIAPALPGPFDVVASVCLLTQIIDALPRALAPTHPRFLAIVQAMRTRHLKLLIELARPGGIAMLVTDIVSSATYPQLANVSAEQLLATLRALVTQGNFFTGVNPAVLDHTLRRDAEIAPQVAELVPLMPWLWDFGPRTYAVCGWQVQRRA